MAHKNSLIRIIYDWFVLTDILFGNSNELNLILPKFARPLIFLLF